jgi:hypothetical protein
MLVRNWRRVLRYAWSVKLMAAAAVLTGLEAVLPSIWDWIPMKPEHKAGITFAIVVGALVLRFKVQSKISGE